MNIDDAFIDLCENALLCEGGLLVFICGKKVKSAEVIKQIQGRLKHHIANVTYAKDEIRLSNETRIRVIETLNPHSLRGLNIDCIYLDEIDDYMKPFWFQLIKPYLQSKIFYFGEKS